VRIGLQLLRLSLWQLPPNKRGFEMTGGRDQLCRPKPLGRHASDPPIKDDCAGLVFAATVRCGPLLQKDPAAASGISLAHQIVSRSGRISAIPMAPPTSMMTPQIMKPVLKPSSGVAADSTTLPMT
jgi:hypothetical protein